MLQKLKSNFSWIILGVVFVLGLISRLNIINKTSFWYDEAFSGVLIKQDIGTILKVIYEDRVHPPVYYFLLKLWALLFGNTDTTLRTFSVIFGMALVVAAFILIKKLFNTKAALIAAGIFALSPYFILYSLEARSYVMLGFESLLAIYLFIVVYRKSFKNIKELWAIKQTKWLLTVFLLMLLTHYLGIILIAAMCALFIGKLFPKLEKLMWAILAIIFVIILARGVINGGNYRIYPKESTHTRWLNDATPLTPGEMLYSFLFGVDSQALATQPVFNLTFINNLDAVFIVIIVLSVVLCINYIKNGNAKLQLISKLFLLTTLATTVACLFGINIFVPRYVMFIAIPFVVWISAIVGQLNLKAVALFALAYILMLTQVVWVNSNRYFDNIPELQQQAQAKRIVVRSPFDYLVLKYYLNETRNLYFLDSDQWQMRKGPWLFVDRSQIIDKTIENDVII